MNFFGVSIVLYFIRILSGYRESMTTSNILAPTPIDDLSSPAPILDEQPENVSVPSENTEKNSTPTPQNSLY
jgi:hypothetical protein